MRSRRKTTWKDLPTLCVLYSAIFATGLALPAVSRSEIIEKGALEVVSGKVLSIGRAGKGKLSVHVQAADRIHHLWMDDIRYEVPALNSLNSGQEIMALIHHDALGRDLDWVWAIQRNHEDLLTYDDTHRHLEGVLRRSESISRFCAYVSSILLSTGVALRLKFGAWKDVT